MIIKKREVPHRILQLQALVRRLPAGHPKIQGIKEQLSKRLAGYKGEKAVDYQLNGVLEKEVFILNDLRLKDSEKYFQIDSIIVSESYIILLEIKNIKGTIYFDSNFHQLIRSIDGIETAFQDPVTQSLRHKEQMKNWLKKHNIHDMPVIPIVVISNSNTLIRTSSNNSHQLGDMIVNSHFLPTKVKKIHHSYKKPILSVKETKKLIRLIKKGHTEEQNSVIDSLSIDKGDILKGVICPNCSSMPMERIYGSWLCRKCDHKEKNLHLNSIEDYCLLFGTEITNLKLRNFLCIRSEALATRILKSAAISSKGSTRDRVYILSIKSKK